MKLFLNCAGAALMLCLCLVLVLPVTAQAQIIVGSSTGGAVLFGKGDGPQMLGQVLVDAAYRYPYGGRSQGEIALFYGASGVGTPETGQLGGMAYRHLYDVNPENSVTPGVSVGFFLAGADDIPELTATTMFVGGGGLLDITGADGNNVKAFVEIYKAIEGDADRPVIMRFGGNFALN